MNFSQHPFRSMPARAVAVMALVAATAAPASAEYPVANPAMTYQGRLSSGGAPLNGLVDCKFEIFDAATNGQDLDKWEPQDVQVVDGLLTVELPQKSDKYGQDTWLEISIRPAGVPGSYTLLSPRQHLTPVPFALQSQGTYYDGTNLRVGDGTGTTNLLVRKGAVAINRASVSSGTKLDVEGVVRCESIILDGGADLSEGFNIDGEPRPGMLVVIDQDKAGALRVAAEPYDPKVAGVVSGAGGVKPGVLMGQEDSVAKGDHPVALTGRVYCWVDADANGAVKPGDMLTTSSTPGHAMRATDRDRAFGATIGKAMTALKSGKGLVLVLVTLQ